MAFAQYGKYCCKSWAVERVGLTSVNKIRWRQNLLLSWVSWCRDCSCLLLQLPHPLQLGHTFSKSQHSRLVSLLHSISRESEKQTASLTTKVQNFHEVYITFKNKLEQTGYTRTPQPFFTPIKLLKFLCIEQQYHHLFLWHLYIYGKL